jgi:hypothetical protein
MRYRQPTFNRRKEIMLGTAAKVNPTRTIARRTSLICRKLGEAAAYYFWLVERIGTKDSTRFTITDAAAELEVGRRSIERWNAKLVDLGFIAIRNRSYQGQQTYNEYTLLAINEVIQDDGTRNVKGGPLKVSGRNVKTKREWGIRCDTDDVPTCDTDDVPKRAKVEKPAAQPFPHITAEGSGASPRSEAARSEPGLASIREPKAQAESDGVPQAWVPTLHRIRDSIADTKLDSSTLPQMYGDVTADGLWTPDGLEAYWFATLHPIVSHADWFKDKKKSLGFGWALKNRAAIEELKYGGEKPPKFQPGDEVVCRAQGTMFGRAGVVRGRSGGDGYLIDIDGQPVALTEENIGHVEAN